MAGAGAIKQRLILLNKSANPFMDTDREHYRFLEYSGRTKLLKLPAASCREASTVRKFAIFRFAR